MKKLLASKMKPTSLETLLDSFEDKFVTRSAFGVAIGAIDSFKGTAEAQVRNWLRTNITALLEAERETLFGLVREAARHTNNPLELDQQKGFLITKGEE